MPVFSHLMSCSPYYGSIAICMLKCSPPFLITAVGPWKYAWWRQQTLPSLHHHHESLRICLHPSPCQPIAYIYLQVCRSSENLVIGLDRLDIKIQSDFSRSCLPFRLLDIRHHWFQTPCSSVRIVLILDIFTRKENIKDSPLLSTVYALHWGVYVKWTALKQGIKGWGKAKN